MFIEIQEKDKQIRLTYMVSSSIERVRMGLGFAA
jgi:hypothetical protein